MIKAKSKIFSRKFVLKWFGKIATNKGFALKVVQIILMHCCSYQYKKRQFEDCLSVYKFISPFICGDLT